MADGKRRDNIDKAASIEGDASERRDLEEAIAERDTANLIVEIAVQLRSEQSFDDAMNGTLELLGKVIPSERVFVFERGGGVEGVTFEWLDPQTTSQAAPLKDGWGAAGIDAKTWDRIVSSGVTYIPDVTMLASFDKHLAERLSDQGVTHFLAVALRDSEGAYGYLVAENCSFGKGVDIKRLLETAATLMSSRIDHHRTISELVQAGTRDALTGLLNRRGFDEVISKRLFEHAGEPYVLALMDIDDFKTVNDLHGHDVGDEALRTLSLAIHDALPETAVLGRNGGDEFVAMLFGEDAHGVDQVFNRFLDQELGCEYDGKWYHLSMSIGYVRYPDQADTLKDAYTKADAALYSVKLTGKGESKCYSTEFESQYRSQLGFTPRDIAENVPGAILVHKMSEAGEILFVNDELVEMLECDSLADFMDYVGGTFDGVIHPDDRKRVYGELTSQVAPNDFGAKNFADFRILTKKGNVKNVVENGRLVEIEGVGPAFYVLMIDRDERDKS